MLRISRLVGLILAGASLSLRLVSAAGPADDAAAVSSVPPIDPIALRHYHRAELLLEEGRFQEAIVEYDGALELTETFADAHRGLGFAYAQLGQGGPARESLNRALALDPDNWQAHGGLGNLFAGKGDLESAAREYQDALASNPNAAWIHANLASALHLQNQTPDALRHCRLSLELDPRATRPLTLMGGIYLKQGLYDRAIDAYSRAIDIDHGHLDAYCDRGLTYSMHGDPESALADVRHVLSKDAGHVMARYHLGFVYQQLGRYDDAVREYEAILPVDGGHMALHHNLSRCYARLGRIEDALRHKEIVERLREIQSTMDAAERAIRHHPDDADGYLALGTSHMEHGNPETALHWLQQAFERDPRLTNTYEAIATIHIRQGRVEEALETFKAATEAVPAFVDGHVMAGLLQRKLGNPERSAARLDTARDLAEAAVRACESVDSLLRLASVYFATEGWDRAEELLLRAIALDPEAEDVHERLARVRSKTQSPSPRLDDDQ